MAIFCINPTSSFTQMPGMTMLIFQAKKIYASLVFFLPISRPPVSTNRQIGSTPPAKTCHGTTVVSICILFDKSKVRQDAACRNHQHKDYYHKSRPYFEQIHVSYCVVSIIFWCTAVHISFSICGIRLCLQMLFIFHVLY
jgi:hypothetical protein